MTEKQMFDFFLAYGLSAEGAAGLMGNLYAESGLKSNNLQNSFEKRLQTTDALYTLAVDAGTYPKSSFVNDSAGYGLAQWTSAGRKKALYEFRMTRGVSISDTQMQLDFLMQELTTSYKAVYTILKGATSVRAASDAVLTRFEMPKDQSEKVKALRASYGTATYNRCAGGVTTQKALLSGLSPDAVIAVATEELGYMEKSLVSYRANPNILYSKTDGAGADNVTKYGIEMHSIYPKTMDVNAAWCDAFVDWCFYQAYGIANAKTLLGGEFDDYTVQSCGLYEKMKALYSTPKVGDQVFFTKNGKTNGCYHTGIVVGVDAAFFTTIEGNTSGGSAVIANGGMICKKQYRITSYSGKVLFGRPNYDAAPTAAVGSASGTELRLAGYESSGATTSSGSYMVKVTANALNIRSGAGTSYPIVGCIKDQGSYTIVETSTDGKWGLLKSYAAKRNGWIALNYCKRI